MWTLVLGGWAAESHAYFPRAEHILARMYKNYGGNSGLYLKQEVQFPAGPGQGGASTYVHEIYLKTWGKLYSRLSTPYGRQVVIQNGEVIRILRNGVEASGRPWEFKVLPHLFLSQSPSYGLQVFGSWGMKLRRICLDLVDGRPCYLVGAWNVADPLPSPCLWVDKKRWLPLKYRQQDSRGRTLELEFSGYDLTRWKYWFPGLIKVRVEGGEQTLYRTVELLRMEVVPETYFQIK